MNKSKINIHELKIKLQKEYINASLFNSTVRLQKNIEAILERLKKVLNQVSEPAIQEKIEDIFERHINETLYLFEETPNEKIFRVLVRQKAKKNQSYSISKLRKYHLPSCNSLRQISHAMGIQPEQLKSIIFEPKAVTIKNYSIYRIPKKTGGDRMVSKPATLLKELQLWILRNILCRIPVHPSANGFVSEKSIVTNASPHIGKEIVVNFDLEDFFGSISYVRVKGLFKSFGYSNTASTIFALLCSVTLEDHTSYLPQGSPASPAITNLIVRKMDRRLDGLASSLGFTYTRYADDLTFSGNDKNISSLVYGVNKIIQEEGFKINESKTRFLRYSSRQEVTGLVVNEKLNINRQTLRRFRALIYQIEKDGISGKSWNSVGDENKLLDEIEGFANFIRMVNPSKGLDFISRIKAIRGKLD